MEPGPNPNPIPNPREAYRTWLGAVLNDKEGACGPVTPKVSLGSG